MWLLSLHFDRSLCFDGCRLRATSLVHTTTNMWYVISSGYVNVALNFVHHELLVLLFVILCVHVVHKISRNVCVSVPHSIPFTSSYSCIMTKLSIWSDFYLLTALESILIYLLHFNKPIIMAIIISECRDEWNGKFSQFLLVCRLCWFSLLLLFHIKLV